MTYPESSAQSGGAFLTARNMNKTKCLNGITSETEIHRLSAFAQGLPFVTRLWPTDGTRLRFFGEDEGAAPAQQRPHIGGIIARVARKSEFGPRRKHARELLDRF